jgi:hypothetical protein
MLTGEKHHTSSAYVVMVALDDLGNPIPVPAVTAQTPEQRRRMAAAKIRRAQRKVLQAALKRSADSMAGPVPVSSDLVQTGVE